MGNANASLLLERNLEAGRADKIAYLCGDRTLTFEELRREADLIGARLRDLGVGRGDRVLLRLDSSLAFPPAFLGALRIGAIPVPISLVETGRNLHAIAVDSGARAIVCEQADSEALRKGMADLDLLFLVDGEDFAAGRPAAGGRAIESAALDPEPATADDVAFWLYSSGSTGRPKAVAHRHGSVTVPCETFAGQVLGLREDDRIFSTTKFFHAYGLGNSLLFPLYFGATGVLLSGPVRPAAILATLGLHRPSVFFSVPALYRALVDDPDADEAFAPVRLCVSAAEPLPVATLADWEARFGLEILDGIGSTEMLQAYCSNRPGAVVAGTAGTAVPGYSLRLVDDGGDELSGPATGALEVRGDSCAAFYRREGQEHPLRTRGGWLHTGDRFERRADGTYSYRGRTDEMIKIGGLWVSPIDVERVLVEHPRVAGAAVVGVTVGGYSRIAAFVECEPGVEGDGELEEELRERCRERLRSHEFPHLVRFVGTIPRTPSGKPRRFALRDLPTDGSDGRRDDEGGDADILALVMRHVAGVLGATVDRARADTTFERLGFDSLGGVELRNRLSRSTGLRLPATLSFDHPSPAALAAFLEARLEGREAEIKMPAPQAGEAGEPLAIVGMGCRYPGDVDSPRALWELVGSGVDAISAFPRDRGWDLEALGRDPARPQTSLAAAGGFIGDVGGFDHAFFGISPREAAAMDPQQRHLLEVAWEAAEDGGIDPEGLRGGSTGVFVGTMRHDYGGGAAAFEGAEGHATTGLAAGVVSGRLAYTLGLRGPAITVDTACSSSLVAIHLAAEALRRGECSLAFAGGVTILCTPQPFVEFSRQGGLAADGRCKAFGAGADGTGFADGVGVILLERLSDARRNGHRILAVLRGSAINQDGASNGLTAPHGPAQERVILQALANAGLTPAEVDAVEAHGTGTELGDPIEVGALLATYGRERGPRGPLRIGSVKSNIGHTQAAAGVAGVIKVVQAMRHGVLPKTLHAEEPSPHVDWDAKAIELLGVEREWPAAPGPRRAAVSSFGISGTNAHVILEEPPPPPRTAGAESPEGFPLLLSARSEGALREGAGRLAAHLREAPDERLGDVAFTLAAGRARSVHRAAVTAGSREESIAVLDALSRGEPAEGLREGNVSAPAETVFLFTGQGAQRPWMGAGLCSEFPVFADAFNEVCAEFDKHLERPLREVVFAAPGSTPGALLDDTRFTQPALFAYEVALYRLIRSLGVAPAFLIGHSIGELAAAHVAGVLSLADAAALVDARGRLMSELPPGGAMVALEATEGELGPLPDGLSLAAVNGPASLVVSGEEMAALELARAYEKRGRRTMRLRVSHAFHSARMDPMLGEFEALVGTLALAPPRIPIVSALSGEILADEDAVSPSYWTRQVREPVRFAAAVATAAGRGATAFVELGPAAVLATMARESLAGDDGVAVALSAREGDECAVFIEGLAAAHCAGVGLAWEGLLPADARRVCLPTYAFQRRRFWLDPRAGAAAGEGRSGHPLLRSSIALAGEDRHVYTGLLSRSEEPWLGEHLIGGRALLPAAALLELLGHVGHELGCERIAELVFTEPLVLGEAPVEIQLLVGEPGEGGARPVSIHSRPRRGRGGDEDDLDWSAHGEALLGPRDHATTPPAEVPMALREDAWPPVGAEAIDVDDFYDELADRGLGYGAAFRGLTAGWRRGERVFAEVSLGEEQLDRAAAFGVHPALLDAALQAIELGTAGATEGRGRPRLPFSFSGVELVPGAPVSMRVCVDLGGEAPRLAAVGADGETILSIEGVATREVERDGAADAAAGGTLLAVEWQPLPGSEEGDARLAVLGGPGSPLVAELSRTEAAIETHADLAALAAASAERGAPAIVAVEIGDRDDGPLAAGAQAATKEALGLLQGWLAEPRLADSRLAFVTRGAISARPTEGVDRLAQSPLWGLLRAARSEHPGRFAIVDALAAWPGSLGRALRSTEPELAVRGDELLRPRCAPLEHSGGVTPPAGIEHWRFEAGGDTIDEVALVEFPAAAAPLAPHQVRVAVAAAGVNFRDVLIALDLYPGEASLGAEGAGVVLEVGAKVERLAVGDRVMGLFVGGLGPVAVGDHRLLAPLPEGWSFARGASVPLAFLTAYRGLVDLAALAPGDRVLVHAAAGGVGMAAVQLARHLGAEVFATASPAKASALRELGLDEDHIASSRSEEFAARFGAAGDGQRIDVVLNSLTGPLLDASLDLLGDGGRFVEMGKTDLRDPAALARSHPGVRYEAFDLIDAGPERIAEMLGRVGELLAAGELRPLPRRTMAAGEIRGALRTMSQGGHVGKLVLRLGPVPAPAKTALITGGTGALGSLLARHLVAEHGLRHLLLAGRRGPEAPGAAELREELERAGAEVEIVACDLADADAVATLLERVPKAHPLGTVVHAAGVRDDGVVEALAAERVDSVFAPKVDGALHLHELTADLDLDAFVLFSSVAGVIGSPGQANYAAANSFLDSLAARRQARGLAATSIAWGSWERESAMTVGLTAADRARRRRAGVSPLADGAGLALFDAALRGGHADCVALKLDRRGLRAGARAGALPAILADLAPRRAASTRAVSGGGGLAAAVAALGEDEREAMVVDLVRVQAAAVLGHESAAAIAADQVFKDLGFDSLASVELRNRLNHVTGVRLAATAIFDHPSPAALGRHLLGRATASGPARRPASPAPRRTAEPIAIVGMSCRLPGDVASPADLWRLVASGGDGISAFPTDRGWDLARIYDADPEREGTSYTRHGGFVGDSTRFDADFFGISPREALAMDPQERLLLEGAWEALEDAGIDPHDLAGSRTGVFAGAIYRDYGPTPGRTQSLVSGRVAYFLGLEGPAITLDTACSSSLVAIHLAARELREGECSLALAGGVTVLSTPGAFIDFSRQGGLSADGRCKPFAEAADGTGWSEGLGVVALERLADAERNGHKILALLRGSAVNQDGASNGITAPNGPSQERVIGRALADAGLAPRDVDLVEAHGTGTTLGDPIEAGALLATYGQDRGDAGPLRLGSIKSNIGHTQAAAGVAGVIKVVEAMRRGVMPKTLHVDAPSGKVDWAAGEIELLTEEVPWEPGERPRRAGVSSFGVSGTNAHMILEEAAAPAEVAVDPAPGGFGAFVLPLAAQSDAALAAGASRLAARLDGDPDLDPADVAFSLGTTRARFERRAAAVGPDRKALGRSLRRLAAGDGVAGALIGRARPGKLALLFSGQGAQRARMGADLHRDSAVFAAALDACCEALDPHLSRRLRDLILAPAGSSDAALLDRTEFTQPALFAVETALFRLLESAGLRPDFLIGHSIGELTAAHLAGLWTLPDAARLVAARGNLMGSLPADGAMVAIEASEAEVVAAAGDAEDLSLAAVNGPSAVVVSGTEGAALELRRRFEERGRRTKRLTVSHAFHSPLMEPILAPFGEVAADLDHGELSIPIVSALSGEPLEADEAADPDYWVAQVREPVRFGEAAATAHALGAGAFLEVGPDAVLTGMVASALPGGAEVALIPTLRAGHGDAESIATALGHAHVTGAELDWAGIHPGARRVDLPTYAFQRRRFWVAAGPGRGDLDAAGVEEAEHPLLAAAVEGADGGWLLTGRITLATHPWLADHEIFDQPLFPGTAFLELALCAARRVGAAGVERLTLAAPLSLSAAAAVALRVTVGPSGESGRTISIHSRADGGLGAGDGDWIEHASGLLAADAVEVPPGGVTPPAAGEPIATDGLYDRLAGRGYRYGPAFQGLDIAWAADGEICADVSLAEDERREAGSFSVHPALLDAALQVGLLGEDPEGDVRAMLPFEWQAVSVPRSGVDSLRVRVERGDGRLRLLAVDRAGEPVLAVGSLLLRPVDAARLRAPGGHPDGLYGFDWREVDLDLAPAPASEPPAVLGPVAIAGLGPTAYPDLATLLAERCDDDREAPGVVVIDARGWGEPSTADDGAGAAAARALDTVRGLLAADALAAARLVFLIDPGRAAIGMRPSLAAATVAGLLRAAGSELPGRIGLVETDAAADSLRSIGPAAAATATELQVALRDGRALAPRLVAGPDEETIEPPAGPWRLAVEVRGTLDSLAALPAPEAGAPLEAGEVRVRVRAAGLNFRDVLSALDLYPGEVSVGSEGAGVVLEVGPGVEGLAVGDRVMGLLPAAFGTVAVAEAATLVRVPESLSFPAAAAVPIAFMTALYGLHDLAGVAAGERVLVHAGAGGVGMAAIQLAHLAGAEVFATASESKWGALRELGVAADHIASSRDLDFRERFATVTEGQGVDIVLNSLTGEFVDASLELLGEGGRLVEIGKSDIRDAAAVARSHPGVSYLPFDLDETDLGRVAEMLAELAARFEAGALRPAPITSWDMRRAREAFRHLREGRNVGKVVLRAPPVLDPGATTLLTGGTGALGALFARHLVREHGVRNLLLVSRRGPEAEGAEELRTELTGLGAEVTIAACDVADRGQLEDLLASVPRSRPLGSVFHLAAALDDGLIEDLTAERLRRVMAPKADAAVHLDELTAGLDLSHFVLFSSVAGIFGGAGQANYAAANSLLDALAERRLGEGRPATSIPWGIWSLGGGLGSSLGATDLARITRSGVEPIDERLGLILFDAAISSPRPPAAAVPLDRGRLARLAAAGNLPPLFRALVREPAHRTSHGSRATALRSGSKEERARAALDLVLAETAAVLGHESATAIEHDRAFKEMGFDSLAAVELRNRLGDLTGLGFDANVVFDYPTARSLADFLVAAAVPGETTGAAFESSELEVRELLAGIPLAELRRAGLMGPLLRLADPDRDGAPGAPSPAESIDEMDVDTLIRQSSERVASGARGEEG